MSQEDVKAKQAVLKYDVKGAKAAAQQAIDEKLDLVSVINEGFTAGIQEVGELFEAKKHRRGTRKVRDLHHRG